MYDYVIVGGGSSGCTLAARLSELADARILLLEAGPPDTNRYIHMPAGFYKMTAGPLTWGYKTVPARQANDREIPFAQARVLGGGSSINAMVYTRGNAQDYDRWRSQEGCDGWGYEDVLPYFRKAEDNESYSNEFHGTGGPLGVSEQISPHEMTRVFVRAAQEFGIPYNHDFNGAVQQGCGIYQVTQRRGRRSSVAVGYLGAARGRANLRVETGCLATRILFEGTRAVGVEYVQGAARERKVARAEAEVIVASGAIGSPKLLMLSGIGAADDLRGHGIDVVADLPGVGHNLQDHVDVYTICELNQPASYDRYTKPWNLLKPGLEYLLFKKGPVTSNLAEGGGFWFADENEQTPDIQFHFLPGAGLEDGVPPVPSGAGCTLNSCHLRPRSRGSVRLRSNDPFAQPLVDPNYWADPYDFEMSRRGFKMAREILRQGAFAKYIAREHLPGDAATSDAAIDEHCRRFGKTDYHPVGACKMGTDEMAVVDPSTRVHGVDALRVADSSIMPLLISSNTNAASIMIGEKAADIIKGNRHGGA